MTTYAEHSRKHRAKLKADRFGRRRVCSACVRDTDDVIGAVYSALGCDRCKRAPCHGAIVSS